MKYFKSSGNHTKDTDRIIGELINIVYGVTFYENGEMMKEPKPKHNTYIIDNVEYEVHPNITLIYLHTDNSNFRDALSARIKLFDEAIQNKYGKREVPIGFPGSTQYLLMENANVSINTIPIGYVITDGVINWTNTLPYGFSHLVYLISKIGALYNLPIPGISANQFSTEVNLMSLSSIIYDDSNIYNITDGIRSPDYPCIDKYNNYQNENILQEYIYWNYFTGLMFHIMHLSGFDNLIGDKQTTIPKTINRTLLWAKWEWLKLFNSPNLEIPWAEQIVRGLLDDDDSLIDESLTEVNKKSKGSERYKCFITGIPIYEDCYVFDIYERIVREHVPSDKVDDYEDAIIITEEMLVKEQESVKSTKQKETAAKKAAIAAKKKEKTKRQLRRQKGYSDDSDDENGNTTVLASQVEENHEEKTEKKAESSVKKTDKKTDKKPTAKKDSVIKKGTKKQVELVLIERKIKYKTPKCVLISPWFIHHSKEYDPIVVFEKATNTKVHLYRTFCPVTLHTVISEFPISALHKYVLHDINAGITINSKWCYQSANVNFIKDFKTSDVLNASKGQKIIARFSPK